MLCVVGEALIDLLPTGAPGPDGTRDYRAHPGGSPFNVAIGLARLGRPTALQARLSSDAFGHQLRRHAQASGVDLTLAIAATEPSTLAVVGVDEFHEATYDFYVIGTADWAWTPHELARAPMGVDWIHFGSLASWLGDGAAIIADHVRSRRRESAVRTSYDPNVRPLLMPDRREAIRRVEANVALADLVKASRQDLDWLYPDRALDSVMRDWLDLGPGLVVVTDGGRGAYGLGREGGPVFQPAFDVTVVDTVGAGDAFMSGLIDAAADDADTEWGSAEQLARLLRAAGVVAALTVSRAGAQPPTRAEVGAARHRLGG